MSSWLRSSKQESAKSAVKSTSQLQNETADDTEVERKSVKGRKGVSKRSGSSYSRIVGKRKPVDVSKRPGTDASMGMSTFSSMTDRFRSFLNGESEAVRMFCLCFSCATLSMKCVYTGAEDKASVELVQRNSTSRTGHN